MIKNHNHIIIISHHHILIKSSYLVWYSATRKPSVNVTAGMWDGVLAWITANEYLDELGDGDGGDDHDGGDHDGDDHVHDHHNHLHHDSRQDLWLVRKQNFLQKSRLESDWITLALMIAELGQTFFRSHDFFAG